MKKVLLVTALILTQAQASFAANKCIVHDSHLLTTNEAVRKVLTAKGYTIVGQYPSSAPEDIVFTISDRYDMERTITADTYCAFRKGNDNYTYTDKIEIGFVDGLYSSLDAPSTSHYECDDYTDAERAIKRNKGKLIVANRMKTCDQVTELRKSITGK